MLLKCFPRQGALVGPEGSRVHSAWNCRQSPPPTAWLLPTPAWPLCTHLFPAQPASLHFSSSSLGLLHFLPAQRLSFSCAAPPAPSCPPTGLRHWHWPPRPPVAWPFPSLFGALPKSAITSTHFSISLTQGNHCPLHKGGPSCVHAVAEKGGLPRGTATTFMPRPDTTCHMQAKHTPHVGPHDMCREQVCQAQNGQAGSDGACRWPTVCRKEARAGPDFLSLRFPLLSPETLSSIPASHFFI